MCHTYGTWLLGDPRGFRTRHHREHVEGDYRNPPPEGQYNALLNRSRQLMKRDPVYLTLEQRQRAVNEFVRAFEKWHTELRVIAIDRIHLHALFRDPQHNPRRVFGLGKKECSAYMKQDALAPVGGLWAVRCKCLPIRDAMHFESAIRYICDHVHRGAAIGYAPKSEA